MEQCDSVNLSSVARVDRYGARGLFWSGIFVSLLCYYYVLRGGAQSMCETVAMLYLTETVKAKTMLVSLWTCFRTKYEGGRASAV